MEKKEKNISDRKKHEEDDESSMMLKLEKEIKSKLTYSYKDEKEEKGEENNSEDENSNQKKLAAIKLFMIDFKQCDSKKCTGRKLERLKKLKSISHKNKFKGIVLTATANKLVSPEDEAIILKSGVCVIDCSWAKIDEIYFKSPFEHERKLPFVVASNPVNYGIPYKLTCAEAIATALYIAGFIAEAEDVMSVFKWGSNFFVLNQEVFNLYSECKNGKELEKAAEDYLEMEHQINEQRQKNKKNLGLPPNSSEDEKNDSENEN